MQERLDEIFFMIAKETGGIAGLLDSLFSFFLRRTDFYYECDPGDKMGFPPGVALNMVGNAFKKYQDEHYKKHKPKSHEEYNKKLQVYKQQQEEQSRLLEQQRAAQLQQQQEREQVKKQQATQKLADPQPQQAGNEKGQISPVSVEPSKIQNQQKKNGAFENFNTYNGGRTEKYAWSQSSQDVVVGVPLPEGATKKTLKVVITANYLQIKHRDQAIVDGKLYDNVKPDDSTWSLEENLLTLTLEKQTDNIWKTVIKGDQEIDATKVENTKPLDSFDEETQGAIRKIMYDQQQKQLGLPTSDEEKQLEVLKKAWDAEGSPFKGQPFDPSKLNLSNGMINF